MSSLGEHFRPEFLNRIDEIIIFNRLTKSDTEKITEMMLEELKARIALLGIKLTFSPEIIAKTAEMGYDKRYGARPIRRIIKKHIEDTLAAAILDGAVQKGSELTAELDEAGNVVYRTVTS